MLNTPDNTLLDPDELDEGPITNMNPQPLHSQGSLSSKILRNIIAFLIAMLIAILFRSLLFQAFVIPSGSMEPNLLIGDYILVNKYSYGYSRYSFPFGLFGLFGCGRAFFKEPARGDVVVFKYPADPSQDFIKRVVGLPGDKIQVVGGTLYINNAPVKDTLVGSCTLEGVEYKILQETLPGGRTIKILKDAHHLMDYSPANNTGAYIVPEGHYFMMGDNRDYSRDSRFSDVGAIPQANLVGCANSIFFSLPGRFLQIWKWGQIRFSRMFTEVR